MTTYGVAIPFVDHCGIEALAPEGEATRLRLALAPHHANHLGIAHGGVLCTLVDVAMGTCARRTLGDSVVTLSMQTSFLAPGRGTLVAEGRVRRAGRSIVHCEATVTGADGTLVATGSGVFKRVRDGAREGG